MNSINFKQYDTRWAKLGYPKAPHYIKDCGCGEVAIANCIIEMEKYAKETPKTIQPYCKQYAAPNGNGTYFSGIPKMMEHYGMTEVKEHATMDSLWKELAKGGRVAIYLMGNRPGGSKKVHWTSSAHFVASVGYEYKNSKHYVFVKDSYSTSSLRNGLITYEENMKNDVSRVWSGKLNGVLFGAPYYPSTPYSGKIPSGTVKKGDQGDAVKTLQTFLNWCMNSGLAVDGVCGDYTDAAIRKFQTQYSGTYGIKPDGIFGNASIAAAKKIVAKYVPTLLQKEMDACVAQAEWMKNYKYAWESHPTVPKSKYKGTCVTYVACVLQRIGILPSGSYVWHDEHGKVYGNNSKMQVIYMSGTIKANKSKLKAGDIVMAGNKYDPGAGSHIFIINGVWNGGDPVIWDNHSAERRKNGFWGNYVYNGNKQIIAVIRLK
jgi:hypothetical protein